MNSSSQRAGSHSGAASDTLVGRQAADAHGATLLPLAGRWCAEMPADVRPELLAAHFPAVINKLALAWPDPKRARRLLEELLIDRRGGRSGFPKGAFSELIRLHGLISLTASDTTPQDIWF